MAHNEYFKGYTAIVREPETLNMLLKTIVLEHNNDREIVTILDDKRLLRRMDKVSIVIFGKDKAFEFFGSTRRMLASNTIDLALYNCKITPIRVEKRYKVNCEAMVEFFVEKKSPAVRRLPYKIYVRNISATGALVESVHMNFEVGEVFVMSMQLGMAQVRVTAQVLREEIDSRQNKKFGCKFLSVE